MADDKEPRRFPRTRALQLGTAQGAAVKAEDAQGYTVAIKDYVNTQSIEDPYHQYYAGNVGAGLDIIEPPYNPYALARLPYENSVLLQCIMAMVSNCDGHGHELDYIGPDGGAESAAALAEKKAINFILDKPNNDYSFAELRSRLRYDYEVFGNCYIEVARDRKGRVTMLHHVPAHTIRRTTRDAQATKVEVRLPREGSDLTVVNKRFARFVQLVNEKRIHFKEFGDPRKINIFDGRENNNLPEDQAATEIIHRAAYYPTSPYGVPRWINQLPAILGSRQAELTNYDFFKENGVPAYVVMVSGGELTQETLDNIESQFTGIKGRSAVHRMAFIEAKGTEDSAAIDGQIPIPKIEIKELRTQNGLKDTMDYDEDCESKTRSSFRLPSLFVGLSEDHTYATANASIEMAEGQVFGPERSSFDEMVNRMILGSFQAQFWAFRSNAVKVSDKQQVVQAVTAFQETGALTPNIAISLANEVFGLKIDKIKEDWGNWPFQIVEQLASAGKLKGLDEIVEQIDAFKEQEPEPAPGAPASGANDNKAPGKAGNPTAPKKVGTQAAKSEPYIRRRPNPNEEKGHHTMLNDDHRAVVAETLMGLREILRPAE